MSRIDNSGPARDRPVILTLGTFDGVHRGHQALLAKGNARALALDGEVLAVAFARPPRLFFNPEPSSSLLTTPDEKKSLLLAHGADRVQTVRFGSALARRSAGDFLRRLVRGRWRARELVVGFNFAFGRNREGNTAFLRRNARSLGLRLHIVRPVTAGRKKVSSGEIRTLIRRGEVEKAAALLGHPFPISGTVVKGRGRGRRLGVPTANLAVERDKILPPGVFAVRVLLPSGTPRGGMMNIGVRPTFGAQGERTVEVHIFDFVGDLTGQRLRVDLLARLREERRFPSRHALLGQLQQDERAARRHWRRVAF